MAIKTPPITPEAPETPEVAVAAPTGRDAFVGIGSLDVARKPASESTLKSLVGETVVFASVASSESKPNGEAEVYKLSDVVFHEDGSFAIPTEMIKVDLSRGMLRTLAAAAGKAKGRNVTAMVIQKKRGLGLK